MSDEADIDLSAIPLFPLPTVVLFPRAVLPLHIFEDRYRDMTADALAGDRLIAMALLKPGWEKDYYSTPAIHPVVCIGKILSHEKLPDGKYNFLLQGVQRARIVREFSDQTYRVAELQMFEQVPVMEIDLSEQRAKLESLFSTTPLGSSLTGRQFLQILRSYLPTADVADLGAYMFLEDVALKQSLLAEADIRHRVMRTLVALEELSAASSASVSIPFPPDASVN